MIRKVQSIRFQLSLSSEQYLNYYKGNATSVSVVSEDGRRIEFPAEHLRPFVRHEGIHGNFELQFDASNKFIGIKSI